jgi:hypothetical protein
LSLHGRGEPAHRDRSGARPGWSRVCICGWRASENRSLTVAVRKVAFAIHIRRHGAVQLRRPGAILPHRDREGAVLRWLLDRTADADFLYSRHTIYRPGGCILPYRDRERAVLWRLPDRMVDAAVLSYSGHMITRPRVERCSLPLRDISTGSVERGLRPQVACASVARPDARVTSEHAVLDHPARRPGLHRPEDSLRRRVGRGGQYDMDMLGAHGAGVQVPAARSAYFCERQGDDCSALGSQVGRRMSESAALHTFEARSRRQHWRSGEIVAPIDGAARITVEPAPIGAEGYEVGAGNRGHHEYLSARARTKLRGNRRKSSVGGSVRAASVRAVSEELVRQRSLSVPRPSGSGNLARTGCICGLVAARGPLPDGRGAERCRRRTYSGPPEDRSLTVAVRNVAASGTVLFTVSTTRFE